MVQLLASVLRDGDSTARSSRGVGCKGGRGTGRNIAAGGLAGSLLDTSHLQFGNKRESENIFNKAVK
jgi:hypothetical protein